MERSITNKSIGAFAPNDAETLAFGDHSLRSQVLVEESCSLGQSVGWQSLRSIPSAAVASPWLIDLAGVLYAFSLHKFASPDSPGAGISGIIEAGSMTCAFLCVLIATRRNRRVFPPSLAVICFAVVDLFALASSSRSFSPAVSFVKGVLSLLVLATCYLVSQSRFDRRFFRSIYRSYVCLLVLGLLAGLLPPHIYPLFSIDAYSGRTTFSVFYTFFGVLGEDTALLILIAPLIFDKPPWISGAFLVAVNVLAGGKTPTGLLLALLAVRFLSALRQRRSWRVGLLVGITSLTAFAVFAQLSSSLYRHSPSNPMQTLYGDHVSENATSFDGRTELWKKAVELLPTVPVLGYGFEGDRDLMLKVADWSGSAHSSYLEVALSSGMLGFLFFVVGLFSVAFACLRAPSSVRLPLLSLLTFLLVQCFRRNSFL